MEETPGLGTVTDLANGPHWSTLGQLLAYAASRHGGREFLRCGDQSVSFDEAHAHSDRLARALCDWGVAPGERVAIMMDNGVDWPLVWFAVLKAGAITVPVNPRYGAGDLAHVLRDSEAMLVLASSRHAGSARAVSCGLGRRCEVRTLTELTAEVDRLPEGGPGGPCRPARPEDTVNFQYTSGTTGFPKACMLSHDYWLRTARAIALSCGLDADDTVLTAQTFSYVDPQWKTVMCLMAGVPLVVLPRFSASGFWRSVREHRATLTYVLGSMPMLLHKQPPGARDRDHTMRLVLCSGIPRGLHAAFEERWGAAWREVYGSTESGLDLIVPPEDAASVGSGRLGCPPVDKQVIVADRSGRPVPAGEVGEILVAGRPMMTGYWNNPDTTAQALRAGWYHTGDLGRVDATGGTVHVGRLKDMIRRGGENIAAAEVESVLTAHPAVLAAAVIGIPDEIFGELPKGFVELRPGYRPNSEVARSVLAHTRGQLAGFKVPAYLEFVDSFALTPSTRVEKRRLLRPGTDQRSGAYDTVKDTWA